MPKVFDLRLHNKSFILISGPSQSGKTYFTRRLITYADTIFMEPITNIYWYSAYLPNQNEKMNNIIYDIGLPEDYNNIPHNSLIVLDDLMSEANSSNHITNLITRAIHHKGLTVIMLTQNMYSDNNNNRTRNLNTHYLITFKNPRNKLQIGTLQRQMYPGNKNILLSAYEDATKQAYGYLFIDLHQTTNDNLRLRTCILPDEKPMKVYIDNKKLGAVL
jgi:hypothetical protein